MGSSCLTLLDTIEAAAGILCPILGTTLQQKCGLMERIQRATKTIKGGKALKKTKQICFSLEKRRVRGEPHNRLQIR